MAMLHLFCTFTIKIWCRIIAECRLHGLKKKEKKKRRRYLWLINNIFVHFFVIQKQSYLWMIYLRA